MERGVLGVWRLVSPPLLVLVLSFCAEAAFGQVDTPTATPTVTPTATATGTATGTATVASSTPPPAVVSVDVTLTQPSAEVDIK